MPPRKSNASTISQAVDDAPNATTAAAGTAAASAGTGAGKDAAAAKDAVVSGINIEDLNLPKSIVTRLAKGVLPPNTQIQGNAMLAMTKSATVFASYLASVANEHALSQSRKTVTAEHVLSALSELEFDSFRPRLEAELKKYNELQSEKRSNYRANKEKNKKVDGDGTGEGDVELGDDDTLPDEEELEREREGHGNGERGPRAKKARLDGGSGSRNSAGGEKLAGVKGGDTYRTEDEAENEGADVDADETEEEVEQEEELEEGLDETVEVGEKDEALDNGDDSD